MIAAFLCGVLYGWLVRNALVTAHNQRVLAKTLPSSDDDFLKDLQGWDELSDEALVNFENMLPSAEVVPGKLDSASTDCAFGPLPPFSWTMRECEPRRLQPDAELPFIGGEQ